MLYRSFHLTERQADAVRRSLEQAVWRAATPEARAEAESALEVMNRPRDERPTMRMIAEEICLRQGITLDELRGPRRQRHFAWPRQEFCARAYETRRYSYPTIGRWLGGRDHTTIIHGHRQHLKRMAALMPPIPTPEASAIGHNGGPALEAWG